jgi:hypothetical protein
MSYLSLIGSPPQKVKLKVLTTESLELRWVTSVPGTGPAGLRRGPETSFSNPR